MGGDGTNFDVINGLISMWGPDQLPPLAVLPSGSGNSFAKDLGIQTLEQGVAAIAANRPRPVDLICFSSGSTRFYFVNLMGLGFVTDVAVTAQRYKLFKDFSYIIGILHRTLDLHFHHLEMNIDNKIISGENCFVEFCNSRYTGGNMLIAPRAKIDDGLMDIVIAGPLSKQRLLAALPRIYTGTYTEMAEITYLQGKRVDIQATPSKALLPDGEITGSTPGKLEVLPGRLRYLSFESGAHC